MHLFGQEERGLCLFGFGLGLLGGLGASAEDHHDGQGGQNHTSRACHVLEFHGSSISSLMDLVIESSGRLVVGGCRYRGVPRASKRGSLAPGVSTSTKQRTTTPIWSGVGRQTRIRAWPKKSRLD